ncbi:hypothetical protein ACX0HA_04645 [Flavobacterium hauense]
MKETYERKMPRLQATPKEREEEQIKLAIYLLKHNGYKIYKVTEV